MASDFLTLERKKKRKKRKKMIQKKIQKTFLVNNTKIIRVWYRFSKGTVCRFIVNQIIEQEAEQNRVPCLKQIY